MRGFKLATLCFAFWVVNTVSAELNDGLYVSNGTDILRVVDPDSTSIESRSIYKQTGTIVGIAYEKSSGTLFWSTVDVMTRGIYRGLADASGNIRNVTKIVEHDVLEVNSLTFDWVSRHIYWTDNRKKTLEVSEADGSNRRILLMTGMLSPRGIYADPVGKYLFWTDQGHKRIERSMLDGSDRRVIVDQNVGLPNQIIFDGSKLFWVDSESKTIESASSGGDQRRSTKLTINGQSLANNEHVFGLAIDGQKAYVTKWNAGRLIRVDWNTNNPTTAAAGNLGSGKIFSAVFVKSSHQPASDNPCAGKGCKALCLPKSPREARCSCPSYGAKTLGSDGKSCAAPASVLLYAVASSGFVCFRDPAAAPTEAETYVVGRSLRPVAVAYDPVTQVVYWSDVRERTVHTAKIDGTNHRILLGSQNGIGLVEGMVVDAKRRQLFYTNIGSVLLEGVPYSWHRVETIRLDGSQVKVKTLVTTADKPRGLALDSDNGHLYYTDWGNRASIVRIDLDGSNATLIRTGLDNPNGIAIVNGRIYFVDSHFKTRRTQTNERYPATPKNGSLYQMNPDGSGVTDVMLPSSTKFQTPFGLAVTPAGDLYVSDWGTKSLSVLKGSLPPATPFLDDIDEIMSIYFSQYSNASDGFGCGGKSCSDLCLAKNARDGQCTCNSYGGKSVNGSSCLVPQNFILVADMNSIKIVSLDERDSNPYIAVQGNPYFANYAALTYDPATQTVYYSDVNRRAIRALYLANMTTANFYRVNEVIDGLAFHDGTLYWTDYANGRISKLLLGQAKHEVIVRGLKRPRGIRIYQNYVYWTEWGENPRVARKSLGASRGSDVEVLYPKTDSPKLVWPNGIFIDDSKNRLYIVDGSTKMIFNCSLEGSCQPLPGTDSVLKHAYDVWFIDGAFYYSDWKSGAINAFRPDNPGTSWTVVGDLMRPSQMFIRRSSTSSSSGTGCGSCAGGECVPLIVNPGCDCKGKAPSYDRKSCTTSPGNCLHNNRNYTSGQEFVPAACVNCQCVGRNVPYSLDPTYTDSLCQRIECPPLDCPKEDVKQPSGNECCPSCTKCGIRITNCPGDVTLTIPSDLKFVVHDYLPAVRDCKGLSREISFVKKPAATIYEKGTTPVSVTARTQDPVDTNECTYRVIVQDKTPPTISCPNDVSRYATDGSPVAVTWEPPKASDNVGLSGEPASSVKWGTSLGVGIHPIKYTVTDTSGLSSSCTFNVIIVRLNSKQNCKIPDIANAELKCEDDSDSLRCSIESCKSGYTKKNVSELVCRNGNWTNIEADTLREACIKETPKTAIGKLRITASGVCAPGIKVEYTQNFLLHSLKRDYIRATGNEETVTAECTPNNDLIVNVEIRSDKVGAEKDIKTKLEEIKTELETGFLKVNYYDNAGVHSAQNLDVRIEEASRSCLPGQIPAADNCEVCPAGKYQYQKKCEKCDENSYNDDEGQIKCKPCAEGQRSDAGAYIVDQCTNIAKVFPTVVVVTIVVVFLLILIIVIVVVVAHKRRRNYPRRAESMLHGNKAYGCYMDDETYDKIAEPMMDASPVSPNQNHYEFLQGNAAAGDNYDTIGTGLCDPGEGNEEGCSPGGSSNHSAASYLKPKSTPPYLTPVM